MLRLIHTVAVVCVLVSAIVLYAVNFQTRRVEAGVQARERQLEKLQTEIQVLRADFALASSPTAIEAAARRLGMGPATGFKPLTPEALPPLADAGNITNGQR